MKVKETVPQPLPEIVSNRGDRNPPLGPRQSSNNNRPTIGGAASTNLTSRLRQLSRRNLPSLLPPQAAGDVPRSSGVDVDADDLRDALNGGRRDGIGELERLGGNSRGPDGDTRRDTDANLPREIALEKSSSTDRRVRIDLNDLRWPPLDSEADEPNTERPTIGDTNNDLPHIGDVRGPGRDIGGSETPNRDSQRGGLPTLEERLPNATPVAKLPPPNLGIELPLNPPEEQSPPVDVPVNRGTPYGDDNRESPLGFPLPVDPLLPFLGGTLGGGGGFGGGGVAAAPPLEEEYPEEPVADVDIELLEIRFVDPGFPHRKLGPRYRIRFKNCGRDDLTLPFWIVLGADTASTPTENMAFAYHQVTALSAGEEGTVDLRLPVDALSIPVDGNGRTSEYSNLFISLDSLDEIIETDETNNAEAIARLDVRDVEPVVFTHHPRAAVAGQTWMLLGEGFGQGAGSVALDLSGIEVQLEPVRWHPLGVQVRLPALRLAQPVDVSFTVRRSDGAAATSYATQLRGAKH